MNDTDLVYLDQAQTALAALTRVDDIKEISNRAEAMRRYVKRAKEGIELQNRAAEVKLRAERRGGEILRDAKENGGRRSSNDGRSNSKVYHDDTPSLDDLGLTRVESSRWQQIAAMPADAFERHIADAKRARAELTTKSVMELSKQIQLAERRAEKARLYQERAEKFADASAQFTGDVEIYNENAVNLSKFVAPASVDLVFTSPPYNQNIAYHTHNDNMEAALYEEMLREVLEQCVLVMRPGARIGLVVPAGVGRDPYIPFASVIEQLVCRAGFTLFGTIVWDKGQHVLDGSPTWGSYRSAVAPRFRDRTERVVWAYKESPRLDIPRDFIFSDEKGDYTPFLQDRTLFAQLASDVWICAPESASRVGHPAPFPVALAEKAIQLFAYPTATILDPFGGSGTTLVAAKKWGLRGVMFDIDAGYCELARERVEQVQ